MFGLDPGRLDPVSSDFDSEHLDQVLIAVKSNVRRRRALTRMPVVLLTGFGALVWLTLFQGSTSSTSAPVEVVGVASSSAALVAVGGDGVAQLATGQLQADSGGRDSTVRELSSESAAGGVESPGVSFAEGENAVPSRPVPFFDISSVVQDPTQAGPSSPPPASDHPLLAPDSPVVIDGPPNDTDSSSVRTEDESREGRPLGALDNFAASPEPLSDTGNPSASSVGSGEGASSGVGAVGSEVADAVRIELAEGSAIDPDNPLHMTLRLRVVDPTGATAGSCGSSVNWSDGTSTGNMCEVGCSSEAGDGVDEVLTFEHTYEQPGVVQVLATIYTGEDCYGSRGTYLLSIQLGDEPSLFGG